MGNGKGLKIEISPEEFKAIETPDKKLDVIYSAVVMQQTNSDTRFSKLEKRKLRDTSVSALIAACTGFLAGWFRGGMG